jgi:hypothetical protein
VVMSGSLQAVLQAAIGDGLSFDPFSFGQNDVAPSKIGLRRRQIANALVVSAVVVVVDERRDLRFEIAGQEMSSPRQAERRPAVERLPSPHGMAEIKSESVADFMSDSVADFARNMQQTLSAAAPIAS